MLAPWLQPSDEKFPLLGKESFETFLKICAEFSEWALDDIGLATRNDAYKVWVCPVHSDKLKNVKGIIERYSSMKLLLHHYNKNIVENGTVSLYIKLDWLENKWEMSYGITNGKKMFKVGEFPYTVSTEVPASTLMKYIKDELDDFNPREHLVLYRIKQDASSFNPGYCQITDPMLINKQVIITTFNLGVWHNGTIQGGEPERLLNVMKDWVKTQKWWNLVRLTVRPGTNGMIDFIIQIK